MIEAHEAEVSEKQALKTDFYFKSNLEFPMVLKNVKNACHLSSISTTWPASKPLTSRARPNAVQNIKNIFEQIYIIYNVYYIKF